ncbi:MAG: hypothetical protein ABIP06_06430 [Pyrinomonadaceae bacterium]
MPPLLILLLILAAGAVVIAQLGVIMSALDNLRREVGETKTVAASAVALLRGLKAKLDEAIASGDPAAIQALADEIDTDTNALAAAVTENTPADPVP